MKPSAWPFVFGACFVVACTAASATFVHAGWPDFSDGNINWATWIQTIVGVVAIAVAWLSVNRQMSVTHAHRESERDALHTELLQVCVRWATDAAASMESSRKHMQNRESMIATDRLTDLQASARILLGKDLPISALDPMFLILKEVAYQISAVKLMNAKQNNFEGRNDSARTRVANVVAAAETLRKIHRARSRVGEISKDHDS